ncbi:(Glutamate--ammonia-ligase) adenylyltransferase OS=Tsukamurella paurometabola (strain ATCC 8368 /DSM / CCUG 35730 / CIP 100753 / JCM 10117 / KCTC 9821/ NBRC 16120 / NCIMB 702349 / NCTC 13040) OX=521096 GN=Tpau_1498 PE=4 SV=1 [Tsukamurella paurometabola]|uniref:(Glutamate--ammonia-ligase) adenylyltransferase n=1 Tax=Tsukamurella paurometabola (strain ATCC 8368 / DSM 20162 / CCUG 35730 / CIP 100753 / JCM 10117 / KCTC 9821 / NBRC 16120 / NCIMB 702349 / NCTC 13040) TaxID=521096 RepID=D5UXN0_TSUPD|nr:bifunctional [glutamine synthetase] adenylyltransferase/[glutamine synthetase]-adenylyl-L-tyrosine phosphorylase [Tsukamurella paurometabola]ADG78122.1 (Glutamate--ammonia-ligase) adenylyltransferase [Tsukamurella paurometabola DSM 20162]SUP30290.1 Glutamate-ammonia-ligase adenylyltransferase [Tsukamurella paurometabola]
MPPTNREVRRPSAGRLGLLDESAEANLGVLGWANSECSDVLWALSRAADPDWTLRALVRLREAVGEDWPEIDRLIRSDTTFRGRLFGLLGASDALGDHLISHPQSWRLLADTAPLKSRDDLIAAMVASVDAVKVPGRRDDDLLYRAGVTGGAAISKLRDAYRDLLMVLAARDLAELVENEPTLPFPLVGAHLADLADAALTAALAVAVATAFPDSDPEGRLAVIAMGKCGARELNYVSDVDVIFVAEPADPASARLAGEMMRIGSAAFFDVDAALRPEGKNGSLTRTLDSHVAYYKRWAKTWEFQALLKARPQTGDLELGNDYIAALSPMVWDASQREDFVPEVQEMRRRVEENIAPELRERELKLGRGGLRDVEFAVQLLQLVHGRTDESLRELSTVSALSALTAGGYVGREDGANFTASYEFLRLLEHRLQLRRMERTHLLPPNDHEEAWRWLARAAHVRPDGDRDATGVLRAELKRQSARVRRLHTKLFYRPLLDSIAHLDSDAMRLSDDAIISRLSALGFRQAENAFAHLKAMADSSRRGRIQTILLPTLLEWLSETPNPDAGLLNYRKLSEDLRDVEWYLRVLRDESVVAQRLMTVLGSSTFVAELLARSPDVIRLYADGATGPKLTETSPQEVYNGMLAAVSRAPHRDRAIGVARAMRRSEIARVASADILGMLTVPEVCAALSSVWAAALDAALVSEIASTIAERESSGREAPPGAPARIAVIGMGRLGGHEIGYGSDADVLFVCDPVYGAEEADAVRWANQVADAVRKRLGAPSVDPGLEVDTGLRPEGRNGPVVRTLAAYRAYYQQWAQHWEVQALLRATHVAGDESLSLEFLHMVDETRYPAGGVSPATVNELRRIKARVDSERLPRGADPATHTKLGRGGLSDVEWTVQLEQLRYASEVPALQNTSTLESLDAIGSHELLPEADVELLRDAWLTATRARNALFLVRGKPVDQLPGPGAVLSNVAFVAGWRGSSLDFLEDYLRTTRRARAVVDRVFWGE